MITLIRQESYKALKQIGFRVFLILLPVFQIIIAFYTKKFPNLLLNSDAFDNSFYAFIIITFFFIALASTAISTEAQYGTLRSLLYRKYSSNEILLSKLITIFISSILVYIYSDIIAILIKLVLFNSKIQLHDHLTGGKTILTSWVMTNFSEFLALWFLMSIVFLLGTLFSTSTPAVICGILGYFVLSIFNQVFFIFIDKYNWLRWNPLNMLNIGDQIENGKYSHLTHLSIQEISIGYLFYLLLFLTLSFISFRKKKI